MPRLFTDSEPVVEFDNEWVRVEVTTMDVVTDILFCNFASWWADRIFIRDQGVRLFAEPRAMNHRGLGVSFREWCLERDLPSRTAGKGY